MSLSMCLTTEMMAPCGKDSSKIILPGSREAHSAPVRAIPALVPPHAHAHTAPWGAGSLQGADSACLAFH